MKHFWLVIGLILGMALLVLFLSPERRDVPNLLQEITKHFVRMALVAVVWAICFRRQIEQRRFTLFSLFVLIAMEAILFWAYRLLNLR